MNTIDFSYIFDDVRKCHRVELSGIVEHMQSSTIGSLNRSREVTSQLRRSDYRLSVPEVVWLMYVLRSFNQVQRPPYLWLNHIIKKMEVVCYLFEQEGTQPHGR